MSSSSFPAISIRSITIFRVEVFPSFPTWLFHFHGGYVIRIRLIALLNPYGLPKAIFSFGNKLGRQGCFL
eukprot:SAG22_NODE_2_length_61565_cov_858.782010_66_plen_70_part_00